VVPILRPDVVELQQSENLSNAGIQREEGVSCRAVSDGSQGWMLLLESCSSHGCEQTGYYFHHTASVG